MSNYYRNVNQELFSKIPPGSRRVLEIGCGSGWMGAAFKAENPDCQYFGIEIVETVAKEAEALLDGVICANIELDLTLPLKFAPQFDALVFGDVLEHLQDPWRVLRELRQYIAPGGACVACIPNVGHWSLINGLLAGRWDYADVGLLDRTHIRFFTLATAIEMFKESGWTLKDATPRDFWPDLTEKTVQTLLPLVTALGHSEAQSRLNLSAYQWVISTTNSG